MGQIAANKQEDTALPLGLIEDLAGIQAQTVSATSSDTWMV
jgi:hypothetical protein